MNSDPKAAATNTDTLYSISKHLKSTTVTGKQRAETLRIFHSATDHFFYIYLII